MANQIQMGSRGEALTQEEDELISLLNQAKYLNLRQISEPEENSLRLVVEEAIADRTETVSTPDPIADILPREPTLSEEERADLWDLANEATSAKNLAKNSKRSLTFPIP